MREKNIKTKFELEMESFEEAFSGKKDMRIVIYGSGRMTATLLSLQKGYRIVGICDRDETKIGEKVYGVNIVNKEFVETEADLLIINTSESYWNTIYRRIKDWKIPIYYRNGELACFKEIETSDSYWNQTYENTIESLRQSDIVSFDIFDTLIMRKFFYAGDIFQIVENVLCKKLDRMVSFVELRKQAGLLDNPTYEEIYRNFALLSGWSKKEVSLAAKTEFEIERVMVVPRKRMVELFHLISKEKKVYLISDMYYSSEQLQRLLRECGVDIVKEQIIVSSEYKKLKEDGSIWNYYKENIVKNLKAIHLGDNEKGDVFEPRKYNIKSIYVRSAMQMAEKSPLSVAIPQMNDLFSSIAFGHLISRLCNDPFALNKNIGKYEFANLEEAGYCLWGNVIFCFFDWLIEKAQKDGIHKLVFFSREGYLLLPLFNTYLEKRGQRQNEITGIYLDISRRAVLTASIASINDIYEVINIPYSGSTKDFFLDRFNIQIDEPEIEDKLFEDVKREPECLKRILSKYEVDIYKESKRERLKYIEYVNCLGIDDTCAVVDSQLYGSTQFYLNRILNVKIGGYYMCVCKNGNNPYNIENCMEGCFTGLTGTDGKDSNIYKYAPFTESYFTAPHGMFLYIDEKGKKKYAERMKNQTYFNIRNIMNKGIVDFIVDASRFCENFGINPSLVSRKFADGVYGAFLDDGFIPLDDFKESFYYDNGISGNKEVPIWE